jgi:hypothetical protein
LTPLVKRLVEGSWEKPGNGDVIFTHCTSYINLFWLQFKLSPTFIVPVSEENCNVLSIHSLVYRLLVHKDLRETKNPKKIEDVIRGARKGRKGPVVVLAEGAPTNGEGLLKFQCFNAELEEDTRIHVLGFSRAFKGCSPNLTATNGLAHLIRQLGKFYTKCEVKAALEGDVGHPPNDKITKQFVEKEREVLSRLTKLPTTALDADSYNGFMDFYNKSKNLPKLKDE